MKKITFIGFLVASALFSNTILGQVSVVITKEDLVAPAISIIPDDEIIIRVYSNSVESEYLYIINEGEGTTQAKWSAYIDYSPLETGDWSFFTLSLCDPYTLSIDGIGSADAVDREIAMKLTPADYVDQLGGELKQIGFYIKDVPNFIPASDLTFRVYAQGPAENVPGEILAEKVLPMANFIYSNWNWVDIEPVQLTGGEYWVSVAMFQEANTYPLTHTDDPLKYNGDWIKTGDGSWSKLSESGTSGYNWAIQAQGEGNVQKIWGQIDTFYGTIAPASQSEVKVSVDPNGFDEEIYTTNIVILTNDPEHLRFDLPLIMVIHYHPSNTKVEEVTVDGEVATQYDSPPQFRIALATHSDEIDIVVTPENPYTTVTGEIGKQPVTAGQNRYNFTVTDDNGTGASDYVLLAWVYTAISEIDNNTITLLPNPVTDYLYINSEFPIEYITIYDLTGKMMKQIRQTTTVIDLKDLSTGVYLMRITTDQGEAVHKFVKQ